MIKIMACTIYLLTDEERIKAKQQAEKQAKDMQLNVVKLCFQAYLRDERGLFSRLLPSVLSSAIYDSSMYINFNDF
jgi:hypothetical protein